jgi:hypothetical protein
LPLSPEQMGGCPNKMRLTMTLSQIYRNKRSLNANNDIN